MGRDTRISWADHSFNPWVGCTKVSPGCTHCYAEKLDNLHKYTKKGWGKGKPRHATNTWSEPLKWNRACATEGTRHKVFCGSLCDILDSEDSPKLDHLREKLWRLIADTPHLEWQLLTKRPENFHRYLPRAWLRDGLPANVWMGTSVEDQQRADERVPFLLDLPARVRYLSVEPLLESVNLTPWLPRLQWIILGGESEKGARPMHPRWTRLIRDACARRKVPFFFKQTGEYRYGDVLTSSVGGFRLSNMNLPLMENRRTVYFPPGSDTPETVTKWDYEPGGVLGVSAGKTGWDHDLLDGVRYHYWPPDAQ